MAVLYRRPGAHGRVRGVGPGANFRFHGGRRRLCPLRDGTLYREHRDHAGALPGGLQEQLLCGCIAQSVAGVDATGTGTGASEARSASSGGVPQGEVPGRAGLIRVKSRIQSLDSIETGLWARGLSGIAGSVGDSALARAIVLGRLPLAKIVVRRADALALRAVGIEALFRGERDA